MKSNKVYIYNPLQAQYYMSKGLMCLGTGIHHKTKKTFWIFGYDDTYDIYIEWINRKH